MPKSDCFQLTIQIDVVSHEGPVDVDRTLDRIRKALPHTTVHDALDEAFPDLAIRFLPETIEAARPT